MHPWDYAPPPGIMQPPGTMHPPWDHAPPGPCTPRTMHPPGPCTPPLLTESQTPVKTLPCPKLLRAVNIQWLLVSLEWSCRHDEFHFSTAAMTRNWLGESFDAPNIWCSKTAVTGRYRPKFEGDYHFGTWFNSLVKSHLTFLFIGSWYKWLYF